MLLVGAQTWITVILNGLPWKRTEIILSFLRLHPSTPFRTLLLTVMLGSIAGLCRETADKLRENGVKAGVVRIRYMRPFPNAEIADVLRNAKAYAVLEKDISFGNEGTVFTNVNSALKKADVSVRGYNFIGGLGGRNISAGDIEKIYTDIANGTESVNFIGIGGGANGK